MKRYLIFGFLTILIITLNFAFIIILTTENKRINYEMLFLLWIVVILAAAGLAYLEKTRKSVKSKRRNIPKNDPKEEAGIKAEEDQAVSNIYKRKSIQQFRIKLPKEFSNKIAPGFFIGYILSEEFNNEIVQSVYTEEDLLLGYINKKEEQLCKNLEQLYNEPILCWGMLSWDEVEDIYTVTASVPVLYSEREINHFRKLAHLKAALLQEKILTQHANPFDYLERAEDFHVLFKSSSRLKSLSFSVDPEDLLPFCRILQKEEKWQEILHLKEYKHVLDSLPQPTKHEIKSIITTAKEKTGK